MRTISVENFGGPEVLQVRNVPDLKPEPDQLLIRLHAAGVNPVDSYIRSGSYGKLPSLPYTPGMDGAGVVQAAGSQVRGYRKGQRIYLSGSISGTYAEQCLCLPTQIHPLPPQVSFEEGACLGIPYATASYALFHRGGAKRGQSVLIHGATGGVGLAAVQLARRAGLRIFATGGSETGRVLLKNQGADHVFDHNQPGYHQSILESTGGTGVDLIVEPHTGGGGGTADVVHFFETNRADTKLQNRSAQISDTACDTRVAIRTAFVAITQITMGVDLYQHKIAMDGVNGPGKATRNTMLAAQPNQ